VPVIPGKAYQLHWRLPDPVSVDGEQESRMDVFREVRDELKKRLSVVFDSEKVLES